tara:strand:- start:3744 stop:4442 length:699 start_codon:yes stop_codon:yes gene_type:complete
VNKKTLKKSYPDYFCNIDYTKRKLTVGESPKFKLNAYCINLEDREQNMDFILNEWNDYLNIERFIALKESSESHKQILKNIWENKEIESFPVVIMEDDVFRKNNFTKYWNRLLDLKDCDYVAFDALYLKFKSDQIISHPYFVPLSEHRAMGFTVYYKTFFDRFNNVNELHKTLSDGGCIDMNFTHNPIYSKYTPREQVCQQIVSKYSTTSNSVTNSYLRLYEIAEEKLSEFE